MTLPEVLAAALAQQESVGFLDSLVVFAVSLLVGAFGIYVGGRVVADVDDFGHAVITALIGAIVWAVVGYLLGWIPFLGALLTLAAYVWVIESRYPGGWVNAILVALVAWLASLVVLYALAVLGVASFDALGVPGV